MTRLETRTKESNMYASIWVIKPICEMKVNMVPGYLYLQHRPTMKPPCRRFEQEHIC